MSVDEYHRESIQSSLELKLDLLTKLTSELNIQRTQIKKSCDEAD